MRPLTETTPKPLIKVCGKPLLQHIVEALPSVIDELILVVGYKKEQIEAFCGTEFLGKKVQYAVQNNFAGGTGDALLQTKDLVTGKFLFMYADDIHGDKALALAVEKDHAILGTFSATPELFGVLVKNDDGTLREILEKPKEPTSNTVNIGGFVLTPDIFNCTVEVSAEHGELLVTDMLTKYATTHPVTIVQQDIWIPVGKPEDIAVAESILCPKE